MSELKEEISSIKDRLIEIEEMGVLSSEAGLLNLTAIVALCKITEINGSILENKVDK